MRNKPLRQFVFIMMLGCSAWSLADETATGTSSSFDVADRIFADFCLDAHIPGLVYGVVADGQLVHVGTFGVQIGG